MLLLARWEFHPHAERPPSLPGHPDDPGFWQTHYENVPQLCQPAAAQAAPLCPTLSISASGAGTLSHVFHLFSVLITGLFWREEPQEQHKKPWLFNGYELKTAIINSSLLSIQIFKIIVSFRFFLIHFLFSVEIKTPKSPDSVTWGTTLIRYSAEVQKHFNYILLVTNFSWRPGFIISNTPWPTGSQHTQGTRRSSDYQLLLVLTGDGAGTTERTVKTQNHPPKRTYPTVAKRRIKFTVLKQHLTHFKWRRPSQGFLLGSPEGTSQHPPREQSQDPPAAQAECPLDGPQAPAGVPNPPRHCLAAATAHSGATRGLGGPAPPPGLQPVLTPPGRATACFFFVWFWLKTSGLSIFFKFRSHCLGCSRPVPRNIPTVSIIQSSPLIDFWKSVFFPDRTRH